MTQNTFDAGIDAAIAAVEDIMEQCADEEKAAAGDEAATLRHKAHRVACYNVLTALESLRRGDDGHKLCFRGTRAERLQIYLLDSVEYYLRNAGVPDAVWPSNYKSYTVVGDYVLAVLINFIVWLKEQVEKDATARDRMLER